LSIIGCQLIGRKTFGAGASGSLSEAFVQHEEA